MHDSSRLARQGTPTATIVWDTFEKAARTQLKLHGVTDLRMLVIPHQEPGATETDVRRRAELDAPQIVALLRTQPSQEEA